MRRLDRPIDSKKTLGKPLRDEHLQALLHFSESGDFTSFRDHIRHYELGIDGFFEGKNLRKGISIYFLLKSVSEGVFGEDFQIVTPHFHAINSAISDYPGLLNDREFLDVLISLLELDCFNVFGVTRRDDGLLIPTDRRAGAPIILFCRRISQTLTDSSNLLNTHDLDQSKFETRARIGRVLQRIPGRIESAT